MNKDDKIEFIEDLVDQVEKEIVDHILNDNIPENWSGIELRWYISDVFQRQYFKAQPQRRAEYNYYILSNNL